MGKRFILRLSAILCMGIGYYCGDLNAQKVSVDGELRSRSEMREGLKKPLLEDESLAVITVLRSRIRFSYSDDKMDAMFRLQDRRTLGETGTNSTGNSLGLYEAWGAYRLKEDLKLKIGRQALEYDDKRILSSSNWSNVGNAHDIALFLYEANRFKAHWGIAWNNANEDLLKESDYNVSRSYKFMSFLWLNKKVGNVDISAIWLDDAFQNGTPDTDSLIYRNTLGANLLFKEKNFPLSVYGTVYYQFGHDTGNKKLDAYLLALKAGYVFNPVWSATLGGDLYSGSRSDIEPSKSNTFNKLYGANHVFNGSMEYWTSVPAQGLKDLYASVKFAPNKKFDIDLAYHNFSLVHPHAKIDKKGLGSEIDITTNYRVSPQFAVQGGWSAYFTTGTTDILKNQEGTETRFPHWAYVMLTFNPSFFNK